MLITVNNSISNIQGLDRSQHNALKKALSYTVPGAFFSGDPTNGLRTLLAKDGSFPTGLLKRVTAWCKASKLYPQLEDQRKRPTGRLEALVAVLDFKPYLVQTEAATQCLANHRGIVQAPTGCGKSVMIALTIDALKVKTLVVVPSLELKAQLTQSLKATFGAGFKHITVANVQSLDPKKPLKGYDCVIIDEYHHSAAKTYRDLNKYAWNDAYYRFGFTATPYRADDEEQVVMESIISDVIYTVPYKLAVERGHIASLEAYYIDLPKQTVGGYTWPQVYKELVVNNTHRNKVIRDLLYRLRGHSTLCLVKEVLHGHLVAGLSHDYAHGMNQDTSALIKTFNKGSSCLVATTGVCGEGVDTKPCEYVILAGLGKSKPALMQAFGRCFRTYPFKESGKVILFRDPSHKWTKAHFKAQCQVLLDEYGVIPQKITLD